MTTRRTLTITLLPDWRCANWHGELARRTGRDDKRLHEDVQVLTELGLVERDIAGGVSCPYADGHIDRQVHHENIAA